MVTHLNMLTWEGKRAWWCVLGDQNERKESRLF